MRRHTGTGTEREHCRAHVAPGRLGGEHPLPLGSQLREHGIQGPPDLGSSPDCRRAVRQRRISPAAGDHDGAPIRGSLQRRRDRPSTDVFDHSATIDIGDRSIGLRHLGRGHTDSDIIITVADVVFAGDLVENGAPPAFGDAFPLDWPDTAAAITAIAGGAVVPGHGPVADAAFAVEQQLELAEVARLAIARHSAGMQVDDAATAGGPYPEPTMAEAMGRAYIQLDGATTP